ncbi:hypothetical protein C8R44DRAFT_744811 [Mycena epipterygia]|nr:hypothetical protein C8R44DRAFT_744811 [Mycena epipterygia]
MTLVERFPPNHAPVNPNSWVEVQCGGCTSACTFLRILARSLISSFISSSLKMSNPQRPPFTQLPIPPEIHTDVEGNQWIQRNGQWVPHSGQVGSFPQMDVDSLRPAGGSHSLTLPPVQDQQLLESSQFSFSMRPASIIPGPSSGGPYTSVSRTDMIPIDPRLLPLPNIDDRNLTDPATIAQARGLKPAKKVAGVRQAKDKGKKRARESDSDDLDAPAAKRGRPRGSGNYSKEDTHALFGFIQKELPLGNRGWKEVHRRYNKYRRANKRPKRDMKSLETKYKQYLKMKKPTGTGTCPPEVKRAHELERLINERAGTHNVSDSEFDNSDSGSSDDKIEVVDDPTVTAVAQRAPTPPLRRSKQSAPDLIHKLSQAFNPEVQRARDEDRYHRSAENTQVFTLSQQLRDAHTSAETLRNQISILQQHLNDAERARNVALLKVEMMEHRTEKADRWTRGRGRNTYHSRSHSPRRRSPSPRKIRCEARYADGGACTYWVTDAFDSEKENEDHRRRSPLPQRTQIFYPSSSTPSLTIPWPFKLDGSSPSPISALLEPSAPHHSLDARLCHS